MNTQSSKINSQVTLSRGEQPPPFRVAYIMSRFPKITETFILYEILTLEDLDVTVEVFPLLREYQKVVHPEVRKIMPRAHFHPFVSAKILTAQWYFMRRKARVYFKLWAEVLKSTFGSRNFFFGAIGIFPKSVRFAYEMEKLKVRWIHAHFANHPTVAAFIVHRLTGIPYSFTAHGSDLHVERRMLDKKVASASFAVAISAYNKELMVRDCGEPVRDKIHVVHCGVDSEMFSIQPRSSNSNPLHILCVASFEEVKGHRVLVEACKLLELRGIPYVCHLVGEGPLRQKIEKQIRSAGITRRFHFHGALSRPEIIRLYKKVDLFVLPSVPTKSGKREGIPVVLMEAMATGLPVVTSNLSGIPELVDSENCGILIPPGDVHALANALETLCRDTILRAQMGFSGRKKVLEKFDLRKNTMALLKLFEPSMV
jgi:glycosyltransferase involved in cell wall biosynthesis